MILDSPYRLLVEPLLEYIDKIDRARQPGELITVVVPQFEPIFEQSGKALPWVTELVLGAGAFMRAYWSALVLLAVASGEAPRERPRTITGRIRTPWALNRAIASSNSTDETRYRAACRR